MTFVFRHPNYYKKLKDNLTNELNYDKGITMKKFKIRLAGLGIEAVAIIPFEKEPTIPEKKIRIAAYYLNHNLMKIEGNEFVSKDRYVITYEELPERVVL